MDERLQFIQDALSDRFTMSELCARYGISRRIGYKWLERYAEEGRHGLQDRSRAPHHCPHRIPAARAEQLCELRRQHPFWGARKLLRVLATRHPRVTDWPAASTAADLLARRRLVHKRPRRRPNKHPGMVPIATNEPNDLWTADFKGQFRTGNGAYCYPLTIADQHTRYLLTCHGLLSTETVTARPIFERAFREYGLPRAIRTDKWRAVRDAGNPRAFVSERVVDAARYPASTDSSGSAPAERRP
ncbi:MAG: helix-turn-helix domain-containing protein [Gemmatimonadaceae bacterium]